MLSRLATAIASALGLFVTAFLFYALILRPDLFWLAFATAMLVAFLGTGFHLVASLVHRRRVGAPIFTPRFPNALFYESWISGCGYQTFMGRRIPARGCSWVAVFPDRLRVGAVFPFTLFFLPERLGLEYDIPWERIISIRQDQLRAGRAWMVIRFRADDGSEAEFDLRVRNVRAFTAAVEDIRKAAGAMVRQG